MLLSTFVKFRGKNSSNFIECINEKNVGGIMKKERDSAKLLCIHLKITELKAHSHILVTEIKIIFAQKET